MTRPYKPDPVMARTLDETSAKSLIPDRSVDMETTGFVSELKFGLERSVEEGFKVKGDTNSKIARVCIGPGFSSFIQFITVGDSANVALAKKGNIVAYCPSGASSALDPFVLAADAGFWPTNTSDKEEKFKGLVHNLLSTGKMGSAVFNYMGSDIDRADEFVNLNPGDLITVDFMDEGNKANGVFLSLFKPVEDAPPETGPRPGPNAQRSFNNGRPSRPLVQNRSRSPQPPNANLDTSPPPPPEDVNWLIGGPVTSQSPFLRRRGARRHQGVDLFAAEGTQVFSVHGGRVQKAGSISGYGLTVVVYSPSANKQFLYAHLSNINVRKNQHIKAGDLLGHVGRTAHYKSTNRNFVGDGTFFKDSAPHLHFEILNGRGPTINRRQEPRRIAAGDPLGWLQANGKEISNS